MKFKIHRGTKEIGGSCVEVWTRSTRILIDFGLPLVDGQGNAFEFGPLRKCSAQELVAQGVLPGIKGLYDEGAPSVDGILISHSHLDHYGLINYINKEVPFFLGEASHAIIKLNQLFTGQGIDMRHARFFEKEKQFAIGDISITPYWVDHSAYDAYAFLIEADGKTLFYSGDFRGHGRKANVFKRMMHRVPRQVDVLLLEGTAIEGGGKPFKTEKQIEGELAKVFKDKDKINLVYASGQNIDRIVSVYKACNQSRKMLVVDVYVGTILKTLAPFGQTPYPSPDFANLRVMFAYHTSKRLVREGHAQLLYDLKAYKITKEEIGRRAAEIVMMVRPSMQTDLERITGIDGGNLVYSMWDGYAQKEDTRQFIDYLTQKRAFSLVNIHTSGHADTSTLKALVEAIQPKAIVPIHTFAGQVYKSIFSSPILEMNDGETRKI